MSQAIPTVFDGVNFRSRLEARWGAMFTRLGWRWTYEPFDLDGYIPDFLLHLDTPVLVEVKPAADWREIGAEAEKLEPQVSTSRHEVLLVGCAPLQGVNGWSGSTCVGLLGIRSRDGDRWWGESLLFRCQADHCGRWGFNHSEEAYRSRVCGHHDGDHYLSLEGMGTVDSLWREAGNLVQWRGRL